MDIDRMTPSELTNYITYDGKVLLDIKRLAEAIHKGKVKKVVLADGQEIDIKQIKNAKTFNLKRTSRRVDDAG